MHGYGGGDFLEGDKGSDHISGDAGNDAIDASQRQSPNPDVQVTKEIIDCVAGASDVVYFDKGLDVVRNCEVEHPYS